MVALTASVIPSGMRPAGLPLRMCALRVGVQRAAGGHCTDRPRKRFCRVWIPKTPRSSCSAVTPYWAAYVVGIVPLGRGKPSIWNHAITPGTYPTNPPTNSRPSCAGHLNMHYFDSPALAGACLLDGTSEIGRRHKEGMAIPSTQHTRKRCRRYVDAVGDRATLANAHDLVSP